MGIVERKEREKQEMRQRIIDGAMKMFVEEGYEKTSIRAIAEKIEYSPATIYLYYKDKDELLYEVQREAFKQLLEVFRREATQLDPFERLTAICKSYVRFGLSHPAMYDLMFIINAPMHAVEDKGEWENAHESLACLVGSLQECIAQGRIRFNDVRMAALSVWSFGHGLVSLDIRCRTKVMELSEEETHQAIEAAVDNYLELIKT